MPTNPSRGRVSAVSAASLALLGALVVGACTLHASTEEAPAASARAPLITAPPPALSPIRVATQHNDTQRTGANLSEVALTPANVGPGSFGLLFTVPVDAQIAAQPLYFGTASIADGTNHDAVTTANVVYVATMNNALYAFDADTERPYYWRQTFGSPDTGHQPNVWSTGHVAPEKATYGILSTPVLDPSAHVLYLVARSQTACAATTPPCDSGNDAEHVLYRIDSITGATLAKTVIQPLANSPLASRYNPNQVLQRPSLLLIRGRVFVAFGSQFEDKMVSYHGWVFAYDSGFHDGDAAADVLCTSCAFGSSNGGGIWQAGNGLTSDGQNLYFMTGNGHIAQKVADTVKEPDPGDMENSFVRVPLALPGVRPVFGPPAVRAPDKFANLENNDQDLGSSGPVLLPGGRLLGGGKSGELYLFDSNFARAQPPFHAFIDAWRDWYPAKTDYIDYTTYGNKGPHIHGGPIVWDLPGNGSSYVYAWAERDHLRRFEYVNATRTIKAPTFYPYSGEPQSADIAPMDRMPGGVLSLSANGTRLDSGIVWAVVENADALWGPRSGYFEAFAATTLGAPIYRELIQLFAKNVPPTVANGHVYLATAQYQLRVYGLRQLSPVAATWTAPSGAFTFCAGTDHEVLHGDVNGDGRSDLICHGLTSGDIGVAFADKNGQLTGAGFSLPAGWCHTGTDSLHVGDFDGDGHADLYCHDKNPAIADWIAFAGFGGLYDNVTPQPFPPSNWYASCNASDSEVHVGDFDGDGRDDVLCHRRSTGDKYTRFTNVAGNLAGSDSAHCNPVGSLQPDGSLLPDAGLATCDVWLPNFGWCQNDELRVGDFNADQHADLHCHSATPNAYKWILPINPATGSFLGQTSIHDTLNNGWCISNNTGYGRLEVADFNGDGAADTFCHGDNGGAEWVDYTRVEASLSYPGGSSVVGSQVWCTPSAGWTNPEIVVADVDGDRRSDVVCHDRANGRLAVEYAPIRGVATDVACGLSNWGCWMLGSEKGPYGGYLVYRQTGSTWTLMPGAAMAIDVGPDGPWVVNDGGTIYRWGGPFGINDFVNVPGGAMDVGVGANGSVWIIGTTKIVNDYQVWRWNGSSWTLMTGGGMRIDVDPAGFPWLVNSYGQVFHGDGATWTDLSRGVAAYDVGVGADGSVYIVMRDANKTVAKWNGNGWTPVPGTTGVRVTARADGTPMVVPVNGGFPN